MFFSLSAVLLLTLGYWASRIHFEEDVSKLIPSNENSETLNQVLQNVNFADKIIVNISSKKKDNLSEIQSFTDDLLEKLDSVKGIAKVQGKFEENEMGELLDFVSEHLPLYLDDSDYEKMDSLLAKKSISKIVENTYQNLTSPTGIFSTKYLREDPLGLNFLGLTKFRQLQSSENFQIQDGYLVHQNQQNIFVFITPEAAPNETSKNKELVSELRELVQNLNTKYKNNSVSAAYFGATPVSVANAERIKSDIILTLSISFVLLFALFIYFYRKPHIPLIIIVPALFGSLLGMTLLYFLKGTISTISIGIGSVLLGLTLDYSLHILSHYRSTGNIEKLFRSTVKPLLICAIFTAADFLCLLFLKSDVLGDLGIFAAVSVVGAAVFSLLFIPQVYSPGKTFESRQNTFIDKIARLDLSKNKFFLILSVLLIIISFFTYKNVGFENDLNKLNYVPKELQTAENHLDQLNNYASKSIYIAAYGKNFEEAFRANSKLHSRLMVEKKKGKILDFSSIGGVLLSKDEQREKINKWNSFWTEQKKENLRLELISEGKKYGFKQSTFSPFFQRLDGSYEPEKLEKNEILNELFLGDFLKSKDGLVTITSMLKMDSERNESITSELSKEQNILVIDRKSLQEKFLSNLETDFNNLFFLSSIVVFVILFLFFGSLELTIITNLPIFAGWFVTLGMMGLFGLNFNAFNIIITTLIFGLGVDYSIFVTRALIEKYTYGTDEIPAFKSGILMSALATILCFGVLVLAKHPALYSISWIPLIGLVVVVLMSFTIQPFLFNYFIQKPQDKGNTPRTIFNLILTFFTFGYFFVVGFLLNLLAQIFIPILPFSKKKKFKTFHQIVRNYFWLLMYGTPFVKIQKIGNFDKEGKPRIIIANHTSQLDTPTMGMLCERSIFMVNNRVLNSKFFGKAIQMAGFYQSNGTDEVGVDGLEEKIKQGYSVIVFPEGTRSMTSAIQRFHKGAFYLSEKLKLDIQPVLVRGNADLLPKKDNLLKTGKLTLEFLPLIKHDDDTFGKDYRVRTRTIGTYFRSKFIELKRCDEDENYFRNKLNFNYIYKPKSIRKEVQNEFNSNKKTYHQLLDLIPLKTKILHFGCGYGVLDFLLVYDWAQREILGWDEDVEKLTVARNTFTVNRFPVRFVDEIPLNLLNFDHLILQNSQISYPINPDHWELIFEENEIKVFKQRYASRI